MFLINPGTIVPTITPTIALIEDGERELRQKSISALVLTATTLKAGSNIWKLLEQGKYPVIFAVPEIVFAP